LPGNRGASKCCARFTPGRGEVARTLEFME
jgi:hypothetical protein